MVTVLLSILSWILHHWRETIIICLGLALVAFGGVIKMKDARIDSLKLTIEARLADLKECKAKITDLRTSIDKQNAAIDTWKTEAQKQKKKVEDADARVVEIDKEYRELLAKFKAQKPEYTIVNVGDEQRNDGSKWFNTALREVFAKW